jgi:hypothetical protein
MPTGKKSNRKLMLAIVARLTLPVVYVLSWGPIGSIAVSHAALGAMTATAYAPVTWFENNTPLSTPLRWYWDLYSPIRPDNADSPVQWPEPTASFVISDDMQYFPPGPECKLTRQVQAIEEYARRQQGLLPTDDPTSNEEEPIRQVEYEDADTPDNAEGSVDRSNEEPQEAAGDDEQDLLNRILSPEARAINRSLGLE